MALPTRLTRESRAMNENMSDATFRIDFVIFMLFLIPAVMGGLYAITTLQHETASRLYIVATQQNDMLSSGSVLTMFVALTVGISGVLRFNFNVSTQEEIIKTGLFTFMAFSVARIAAALSAVTMNRLYNLQLSATSTMDVWATFPIVYTSAVYEEIVFSFGFGTGIYLIIYFVVMRITGSETFAHWTAVVFSSAIVGVLFAAIHIGVYGTSADLMGYLWAARFVYNFSYLASRNGLVPIGAHVLHNTTITFMG